MLPTPFLLLAQTAPEAPQGLFEAAFDLFHRGGPVMWPILICSLMGLTVAIERLFEKYKIDDLPVVDAESRLVGYVDIQDLPKMKVM